MTDLYLGVDLGQAHDFTAIVVAERMERPIIESDYERVKMQTEGKAYRPRKTEAVYHVRHLERLPLGTTYPAQVARVAERYRELLPLGRLELIVDATGVGRPVVDMLRDAGLRPNAVTITGADAETRGEDGIVRVPKRNLVSALQVLLQSGRLKVARDLPIAETLAKEMLAFKVTISKHGHDSYGNDWRENPHDDLVLATALAVYWPERHRKMDREALRRAYGLEMGNSPWH